MTAGVKCTVSVWAVTSERQNDALATSYFWCKLHWETADKWKHKSLNTNVKAGTIELWLVDRDEEENSVIWWIWKQRDPIGLACFLEHSPARTCGNRERGCAVARMGMSDSRWFLLSLPRLINSNKRTSASRLLPKQGTLQHFVVSRS